MKNLELTDAETHALARLLRDAIAGDRYPLSPRLDPLKVIRAKLEMTQQQFAAALGISTGQLGDYERGYTRRGDPSRSRA